MTGSSHHKSIVHGHSASLWLFLPGPTELRPSRFLKGLTPSEKKIALRDFIFSR